MAAAGYGENRKSARVSFFTLALNLVRDRARHLNHVRAHKEIASLYHAEASHADGLASRIEGQNQLDRVLHALFELPEIVRHAFLLHRFEGLSHNEIAQRLGISTKTVERHVRRASEYCLTILAEDWN
jgi:RNA polymerase sigma-70 factor (ECF subfamily)